MEEVEKRDYLFDNIKVLLIFLVVFGHAIEYYIDDNFILRTIYITIYFFHMPLFVFVSGYFSGNLEKCRKTAFEKLLIPFILFNMLWYLFLSLTSHKLVIDLLTPGFALWYLVCLFIWRLFLRDLVKLRHILLISIIFGVLVGLIDEIGLSLSLSRLICFLPFFLAGYYFNKEMVKKIRKLPIIIPILFAIIVISIAFYITNANLLNYKILYMSDPYISFDIGVVKGFLFRILIYVIAFSSILFIRLVPNKKNALTYIGEVTLTIYVFHTYFIQILRLLIPKWNANIISNIIILTLPLILIPLLSTKPFIVLYEFIEKSFKKLLFKKKTLT